MVGKWALFKVPQKKESFPRILQSLTLTKIIFLFKINQYLCVRVCKIMSLFTAKINNNISMLNNNIVTVAIRFLVILLLQAILCTYMMWHLCTQS